MDLLPERIQAALYKAFDIQTLYKPDMHQVTIFATITTSTPTPSPPYRPHRQRPRQQHPRPRARHPLPRPHRPSAAPPFTLWQNPLYRGGVPRS